jgi:hypothetical protein
VFLVLFVLGLELVHDAVDLLGLVGSIDLYEPALVLDAILGNVTNHHR